MTTIEQIMQQWQETLSPEEKRIAIRSRRETEEYMRERKPESVVFSLGTSTPHYKAILETEVKV